MMPPEVRTLSAQQISELLDKADVIETWLKAVRAHAHEMIEGGERVPGWALKPKRGRRQWKDARVVKQRLASEGLMNFIVEELVSPAQAEKLARKQGLQLDLFDLVETKSSGVALAREEGGASASSDPSDDFAD